MVERRLQITLVAAATLAAVMLGLAQDNPAVILIGVFTGLTSVIFTDIKKWLVLDRRISYIAMVAAAVISLNGFWRNTSEAQLLAIANMLVFVQIALLYQEKTLRVYSHLAVFSVLQVVVAALLNVGPTFVVLLCAYVAIGSYAVMMYSMHREVLRLNRLGEASPPPAGDAPERWRAAFGGAIRCGPSQSHAAASAHVVRQFRWLQSGPLLLGVVGFASFFFLFSPRLGGGGWQPGGSGVGVVGFNDEITFRQLNRMIENDDRVMRVSFVNVRNGQLYKLYSEPYLRGAALAKYSFNSRNPKWEVAKGFQFRQQLPQAITPSNSTDLIKQEISLRSSREGNLFGVAPFYQDDDLPEWVTIDPGTNTLKVDQADTVKGLRELRYSMRTTGLQAGAQAQIIRQFPHNRDNARSPELTRKSIESEISSPYLKFRASSCPTIKEVADRLMSDARADEGRIFRCQLLMRYLLGEDFTYSLDAALIREKSNPGLDPVEDFFANHKTGYCAYYASALTLMLRSQGIPARIVVGYKGGEYNEIAGHYVIRSRDAHAWVEAYLRPEDLAGISDAEVRDIDSPAGAWLRLDPTPSSDLDEVDKGAMAYVDQVLDYSRTLWSDYVLEATSRVETSGVQTVASRRREQSVRGMLEKRLPAWAWNVFSAVPVVALATVIGWALVGNFPAIKRWKRRRRRAKRRPISSVEFYNRLEKLAAARQLWRDDSQTPQEFAVTIAEYLQQMHEGNGAAAAAVESLQQIIRLFYDTRFGGRPLDSAEADAIEKALDDVSTALQPPRG